MLNTDKIEAFAEQPSNGAKTSLQVCKDPVLLIELERTDWNRTVADQRCPSMLAVAMASRGSAKKGRENALSHLRVRVPVLLAFSELNRPALIGRKEQFEVDLTLRILVMIRFSVH